MGYLEKKNSNYNKNKYKVSIKNIIEIMEVKQTMRLKRQD